MIPSFGPSSSRLSTASAFDSAPPSFDWNPWGVTLHSEFCTIFASGTSRRKLFVRLKFFLFPSVGSMDGTPEEVGRGLSRSPGPDLTFRDRPVDRTRPPAPSTPHWIVRTLRTTMRKASSPPHRWWWWWCSASPRAPHWPSRPVLRLPRLRPVRWDALKGLRCGRAVGMAVEIAGDAEVASLVVRGSLVWSPTQGPSSMPASSSRRAPTA